MRIQVENARKEEGKHSSFSFVQPASKLGDIDDMPWKDNDISVEGEYWFDGSHLIVEGVIHTRDAALSEVYGTEAQLPEDVNPYNGEYIDLTETIRELLILSEPMKVLCRPDCAGLCPQCGANLNEGACSCPTDRIDPRLAVLSDWLKS